VPPLSEEIPQSSAVAGRQIDTRRSWKTSRAPKPSVACKVALFSVFRRNVPDAVRMGAFAARLPISLAGSAVTFGRVTKWGDVPDSHIAFWALYPSRRLRARVSAFIDHLKTAFSNGTPDELSAYIDRCSNWHGRRLRSHAVRTLTGKRCANARSDGASVFPAWNQMVCAALLMC